MMPQVVALPGLGEEPAMELKGKMAHGFTVLKVWE